MSHSGPPVRLHKRNGGKRRCNFRRSCRNRNGKPRGRSCSRRRRPRRARATRSPPSAAGCRACGSRRSTSSRARAARRASPICSRGAASCSSTTSCSARISDAGCAGCSMVLDQICPLPHLHARDTSFAAVSRAPIAKIEAYRQRMGWEIPWVSSFGSDFNHDFGRRPERARSGPGPGRRDRSASPCSSATAARSIAPTSRRAAASRRSARSGPCST